jgi:dihydrofolate reductase
VVHPGRRARGRELRPALRGGRVRAGGRKTYQGLARVWPTITDDRGFADRVNALPKFVASGTLAEPLEWNSTLIKGDVAEGVRELKRQHSGHLLSYGCGELARYLTAHGLVDEIRFTVFPTVLGEGVRPFGARVRTPKAVPPAQNGSAAR